MVRMLAFSRGNGAHSQNCGYRSTASCKLLALCARSVAQFGQGRGKHDEIANMREMQSRRRRIMGGGTQYYRAHRVV